MCFSPDADFGGGAVIAAAGVLTLRRVRAPTELIVGALPLLFGLHQFVEGFVWLSLQGRASSGLGDVARDIYLIFAHGLLPIIVPVGFTLIEPDRRRRRWMLAPLALGLGLGSYLLWQVIGFPTGASIDDHCVDYLTHAPNSIWLGLLYVLATCGPALISSRPYLRWFGAISAAGVIAVAIIRVDLLTSVWCAYVALVSLLIAEHFRRVRRAESRRVLSGAPPDRGRLEAGSDTRAGPVAPG